MEGTFVHMWNLLVSHGVVPDEIHEAEEEWNKYSLQQQRDIYRSIRDKIRAGKFVNYHPVLAIKENAPKAPRIIVISAAEYYRKWRGEGFFNTPQEIILLCHPYPTNWNGRPLINRLIKETPMVRAKYDGSYGIYTRDEARVWSMTDIVPLN